MRHVGNNRPDISTGGCHNHHERRRHRGPASGRHPQVHRHHMMNPISKGYGYSSSTWS